MKSRPHIMTQTRVHPTESLNRSAHLIADRVGEAGAAGRLADMLGYCRVLIRVMKTILDLTLHNDCFTRRRDVLASPELRKRVMERLGGAHALLKWRRKDTWNKARLAAIASGKYRPMPAPHIPLTAQRPGPKTPAEEMKRPADKSPTVKPAPPDSAPAHFRLPVLQNLNHRATPRASLMKRAKPQTRYPSVVLWPHELDGQYVPNFKNRAAPPDGPGYLSYREAAQPSAHTKPAIFAPP